MIITVFVTTHSASDQWRAELLEQSWIEVRQPGELVRLVACPHDAPLPMHGIARVVRTRPCDSHPWLRDRFPGYDLPSSLLEWLVTENVDATLLLLDRDSVLLQVLAEEVEAGGSPNSAVGNRWPQWPAGEGPFGLADEYRALGEYCVNQDLDPPKVQFPVLIHSSDLRRMAARWLELTGLIRAAVRSDGHPPPDAHKVAYTIAAAEYRIPHRAQKLADMTSDRKAGSAVLDYSVPIKSAKGGIVFDPESYQPWNRPAVTQARAGAGREFLKRLDHHVSLRESGALLAMRRPRRCHGVREGRLPDRMMLDIPGAAEPLQLNASASAIWNLCDNQRSLGDIVDVLKSQYDVPRHVLSDDVDRTILHLRSRGAVELDAVDVAS